MNGRRDIEQRRTQAQLVEQQDAIRSKVIATELDLAITFCQVAATTKDPARYDRNIANAQEAYSAAVYFLGCNHLKSTLTLEINAKLLRLNSLLERFDPASRSYFSNSMTFAL